MPVEILAEVHPALLADLTQIHFRGAPAALMNARGDVLGQGNLPEPLPEPPYVTEQPGILPLGAELGDSITLNLGNAMGVPAPVAEWDFTLDGTSIKSRLDAGMMTIELAEAGEYALTVQWTNSEGEAHANTATLSVATAPVIPQIDYAASALAYLDAGSTYAGTAEDVTSVSPAGQGNLVFSKTGSGNPVLRVADGWQFAGGAYLQSQIVSGLPATDGVFAVADLTITSYGTAAGQILDGTGVTLKLRNNGGTLQAVGPVSGLGALPLGTVPYGTRVIIAGQIDDVLDLLSGHDISGGAISAAHGGLTDPAPTRFSTGRYINGTLHQLAIVGRTEGGDWPVTMQEVVSDFRRGA